MGPGLARVGRCRSGTTAGTPPALSQSMRGLPSLLILACVMSPAARAGGPDGNVLLAEWTEMASQILSGDPGRCFSGSVEQATVLVAMAEGVRAAAGVRPLWL